MPAGQKPVFTRHATPLGVYWTAAVPPSDLRRRLGDAALTRWKWASAGGAPEQGFEQAFASLAYAYLKDKSPRLIDFIVGFQLIDRNEDNTKAVGIFGFKVGDNWLYAPVFFLNGDLKGHELLYVKNQDMFVPLKENWVNNLIARRPHVLGEPSPQDLRQLGGLLPDLTRLAVPPARDAKYAADAPPVAGWARPVLPLVAALATKQAGALYPGVPGRVDLAAVAASPVSAAVADRPGRFDLRRFLGDLRLLKAAFAGAYLRYPAVKAGFDRFYGVDFFTQAARSLRDEADGLVKRAESYLLPPEDGVRPERLSRPGRRRRPRRAADDLVSAAQAELRQKAGQVHVYLAGEDGRHFFGRPDLDDRERERLLQDGVLIKDARPDDAVSVAYEASGPLRLAGPTETGVYEVLDDAGGLEEAVVVLRPRTPYGRADFAVVVRVGDPGSWRNVHPSRLLARPPSGRDRRAAWGRYLDGLADVGSLAAGSTYVAVGRDGEGTCPFTVLDDLGGGLFEVTWHDAGSPGFAVPSLDAASFGRPAPACRCGGAGPGRLRVSPQTRGGRTAVVEGTVVVPADYKAVPLASAGLTGGGPRAFRPGGLDVARRFFAKQALACDLRELRLQDTGPFVALKTGGGTRLLTKAAALVVLVRDHGLREAQARDLLGRAAAAARHNGEAAVFVKYAAPYVQPGLLPGPDAPAMPPPLTGVESLGPAGAVAAVYPQEQFVPVTEAAAANYADPQANDPFYLPDQRAMQLAQAAARSGQKEVFDVAMVAGLLKAVRQDSLVDRYLGDLMKALDKLGRIIFMFYWHQEEFEDRYGKQDLPELEDALRNAFEVLGDVVLFLKEKQVDVPGLANPSGLGSTGDDEPSVYEAARN